MRSSAKNIQKPFVPAGETSSKSFSKVKSQGEQLHMEKIIVRVEPILPSAYRSSSLNHSYASNGRGVIRLMLSALSLPRRTMGPGPFVFHMIVINRKVVKCQAVTWPEGSGDWVAFVPFHRPRETPKAAISINLHRWCRRQMQEACVDGRGGAFLFLFCSLK